MLLTKIQQEIIDADGNLLVTGGPGSGKTTISILKAGRIVDQHLSLGQRVLFLSFARATVARVIEAIEHEHKIPTSQKACIHVETYHSFFWRILKTHGYLIGLPRRLTILTPPGEAIALSHIRTNFPSRKITPEQEQAKLLAEETERKRLAYEEGQVCFDLYAPLVGDLLHRSSRIRKLVADMHPVIILDEFQDTNTAQWQVVQALGEFCRLIALADPDQRIYDWLGADPARLDHFRGLCVPLEFDLGTDNHRSPGTDISQFGDDILTGDFGKQSYHGIELIQCDHVPNVAMTTLVKTIYTARSQLVSKYGKNWSLAVLVPTKNMVHLVSDVLHNPPAKMPPIKHSAVTEMEASILGAEVVAYLMQTKTAHCEACFIDILCSYYKGRKGGNPTKKDLHEAIAISKAYEELVSAQNATKTKKSQANLLNTLAVHEQVRSLMLTGNPAEDWMAILDILAHGECVRLKELAKHVGVLKILERGTQLRQALSQDWLANGGYHNALKIIRQAFVQVHFATTSKPDSGVIIMNMHKAKGKQFEEVIIFEGAPVIIKRELSHNPDRIVWSNTEDNVTAQARQNLRVSVTRSKNKTTILTPKIDPCLLLRNFVVALSSQVPPKVDTLSV